MMEKINFSDSSLYHPKGILRKPINIEITDDVISVVLAGGLGNMMFQISTILSYAKDNNLRPLIGYWTTHQSESSRWSKRLNRYARNHHFEPWGGHILQDRPVSLGEVYPKLPWFNDRPNAFEWWFNQDFAYELDTGKSGLFVDIGKDLVPPFLVQGYFFNYRFWHHNRDYILDMFTLDEELRDWMYYHYGNLFQQKTISVHLRLGNDTDFMPVEKVPMKWVIDKIESLVEGKDDNVLIFSDNLPAAKKMLYLNCDVRRSQLHFIEDDPYICMELMSRCDKHILSNSTLSFWGAYMDRNENNPETYIHESFFKEHPIEMIPYDNWKIEE